MNRWAGKVAVVTGASSGIGVGIAVGLVKNGMIVVGLARRKDRMDALVKELDNKYSGKLYSYQCDVSKEDEIIQAFKWIKNNLGGVDVLVNNAGLGKQTLLTSPGNGDILRNIVDVNILGLSFCTREAIQSMKQRKVDGHIFHINSIVGHKVWHIPNLCPNGFNMYPASKHAVTALTETLRLELMHAKSKIKVTSISPGAVESEIFNHMMGASEGTAEHLKDATFLVPDDISEAVLYCLGTPPHVQIHELTIRPVGEQY